MSEWIHSYIVVVFHLLQSCNLFLLCCYSSLSVLGPKELPCLNTNSYLECRSIASEVKSRQNDSEKSIKWEVDLKQMVADFQKEAKKELSDELDTSRVTKKTEPETGKKESATRAVWPLMLLYQWMAPPSWESCQLWVRFWQLHPCLRLLLRPPVRFWKIWKTRSPCQKLSFYFQVFVNLLSMSVTTRSHWRA